MSLEKEKQCVSASNLDGHGWEQWCFLYFHGSSMYANKDSYGVSLLDSFTVQREFMGGWDVDLKLAFLAWLCSSESCDYLTEAVCQGRSTLHMTALLDPTHSCSSRTFLWMQSIYWMIPGTDEAKEGQEQVLLGLDEINPQPLPVILLTQLLIH